MAGIVMLCLNIWMSTKLMMSRTETCIRCMRKFYQPISVSNSKCVCVCEKCSRPSRRCMTCKFANFTVSNSENFSKLKMFLIIGSLTYPTTQLDQYIQNWLLESGLYNSPFVFWTVLYVVQSIPIAASVIKQTVPFYILFRMALLIYKSLKNYEELPYLHSIVSVGTKMQKSLHFITSFGNSFITSQNSEDKKQLSLKFVSKSDLNATQDNKKQKNQDHDNSTKAENDPLDELKQLIRDHNNESKNHHKKILEQQKFIQQGQEAVEKKLKMQKQTCNQRFLDLRNLCMEIQVTIDAQAKQQELLTNLALDIKNGEEPSDAQKANDSKDECVVCMDKPMSVAWVPCGHVCYCIECAEKCKKEDKCPTCSQKVTELQRIYR